VAELIISGQIDRATGKTYEDGRLGQVQLLPDEWSLLARDGDKDGKVDVWTNRADILASIGPIEWQVGTPMIVEVGRRQFKGNDPAETRMLRGIESGNVSVGMFPRPGGGAWPSHTRSWGGRYVEPFGPTGPAYLLTRNFTPINYRNPSKPRYWNESEDPGFGLAVALLADAIAGRRMLSAAIR
jgi:membrane-bound lytic murein transglycosylase B